MPLKQGGLVFCTLVVKMSWGIQSQSRNKYVRQNEPNAGESTQGIEVDAKKANFLSLESPPSLNLSFPISHYEPCKCFFFFFPFHFSYIENNKNDFILSGAHEKMGSPLEIVGYIDSSKKGLEKQYLRTFTQKLPIVQLETLKSMLLGSNPSFITFCYFICLCYLFIYLSWHSRYFVVSLTRALLYHTSLHA